MKITDVLVNRLMQLAGLKFKGKHLRAFLLYNNPKKFLNYLRANSEKKKRKIELKSLPYVLNLEPNNTCNLKCPLCWVPNPIKPKGYMSFENFKKVIDEIGDYLYLLNLYNLGEPLLHKDIYRMIEYANKKKIFTSISSNFLIFNEEDADKMIASGLDYLRISLDGTSQETYQQYRVGGNYNKVIENIELLVSKKKKIKSKIPFIDWQFLIFKHNEHEISNVKPLAEKLGVDGVLISSAHAYGHEKEWLSEERGEYYANPENIDSFCFLWNQVLINYDGEVAPCCSHIAQIAPEFGNIFRQSFKEIWNNEKFKSARAIFSSSDEHKQRIENLVCYQCSIAIPFLSKENRK
ncbi:MAG: hypothetical protein A2042_07440 [Candidatus Schekmanbacteria bacterium GWA2_38_11]|uniref:Radical SAM core domain-containing protein n=1 Tax=Candidatus Schekmanbacteria bacterium GWA2_38_11 TaxID=1817876 RepID=A0A1F7RQY5_9BACT|nr:MAG: hypothetical protein A2042_07440 [Candidatus Schekmanbacteria bacterium GWA2_38_11]